MAGKKLESRVQESHTCCLLVFLQLPYEFTSSKGFWTEGGRQALSPIPERISTRVTENSSRKTYIFNVETNGASWTSQSIGYLQVLLYFVTVKRFPTDRRTVGDLANCCHTEWPLHVQRCCIQTMKIANKALMQVALKNSVCQWVDEWALPCMHARPQLNRSVVCWAGGHVAGRGELGSWVRGIHGDKAEFPFNMGLNPHSVSS